MLFNTFDFIFIFLPLTLIVYYLCCKLNFHTLSIYFLVVASLIFYSYWNLSLLPIILFSLLFNFAISRMLVKFPRKFLLAAGIAVNLLLLAYYKYSMFAVNNINLIFAADITVPQILLPLAISFFTFQQIGFLVDTYRGSTRHYRFIQYALFVTFFPQLIAGPIVQHDEIMPQLNNNRLKTFISANFQKGLFIFFIGLFKKVVLADSYAIWATKGFDQAQTLSFADGWVTSLSYTFQLYFDFSGYCDMAIGLALLFNIALPLNFNSPYKALNIQDFWKRWHMTLGRFLTKYLYIPLGGNRKGKYRTYLNLFIVFFLSGIWHGAGWTFVAWGTLHAIAMVVHRIWSQLGYRMNKYLAWLVTFLFINCTWVIFRANDFGDAWKVLKAMVAWDQLSFNLILSNKFGLGVLGLTLLLILISNNSFVMLERYKNSWKHAAFLSFLTVFSLLFINRVSEFLYFNF